eukprot:TRINITY_DN14527_c0_g1_i12.p1 TRINITY_DN14527_c0_g1~~TRINITY_DN14527_c0_g1_i12.p1  ORF type:complete len:260 (+),score=64.85 TRINITY_DN14527_c0_g1_i12:1185-1964(+)
MLKIHYGNTIKVKELPPEIDFSKAGNAAQQKAKENNEGPCAYELPKEIENLMYPKNKEVVEETLVKESVKEINPIVQEVKPRVIKDKAILNYGKIKGKKQNNPGHNHHDHHDHHNGHREKRKLKQIDVSHHENSRLPYNSLVLANYRFKNMQKEEVQAKEEVQDEEQRKEEEMNEGKMRLSSGDEYEGERKDGKMHGKGVYRFANGDRYEGEYVEGAIHGKGATCFKTVGTYFYADGSKYEGEWKEGAKNGKGNSSCQM